jgi:hypothetical protein
VPDDPAWLDWLASTLQNGSPIRAEGPLSLWELVGLLENWVVGARPEAWARDDNRRHLADETWATREALNPWIEAEVLDCLDDLFAELGRMTGSAAEVRELSRILVALRGRLDERALLDVLVHRLVFLAQVGFADQHTVFFALENLDDLLTARGYEPRGVRSHLAYELTGRHQGSAAPPWQQRLSETLDDFAAQTEPRRLVVWLEYENAEVHSVVRAGPVTFFRWIWAVPNARLENGQDFEFRDDLRRYLEERPEEEEAALEHVVVVRVDLGVGPSPTAIQRALTLVTAIVETAFARSAGRPWKPRGFARVEVDGDLLMGAVQRLESFSDGESGRLGIHRTAAEIDRLAAAWGDRLTVTEIPALLLDAMRSIASRQSLDVEDDLAVSILRTADLRNATIWDHGVLEQVAAWGGMPLRALGDALDAIWRHALWRTDLARLIDFALGRARATDPSLAARLQAGFRSWRDGGEVTLLGQLATFEPEILDLLDGDPGFEENALLLRSVRDSRSYVTVISALRQRQSLTRARHTFVRNCLVHAHPLTGAMLERNRRFARFRADAALDWGMNAFVENVALPDWIDRERSRRERDESAVRSGGSWIGVWAASADSP